MKKVKKEDASNSNRELIESLNILEREKGIKKEVILQAIEVALTKAAKEYLGKDVNVVVEIDRETGAYNVFSKQTVVENVEDPVMEISLEDANAIDPTLCVGDVLRQDVKSKDFSRITTQNAKNIIVQKIHEEERRAQFEAYAEKEKEIITGIVQRKVGNNLAIELGNNVTGMLLENYMVPGEHYEPTDRIKVYVFEVKDTSKGPKINVSRKHPELVKKLFDQEVTEVHDGTVEIKAISREAGSRTKMAVMSNDPQVDPVGACVGINGARVNAVIDEIGGEKIDIIRWDENPAILIENALSPAKVIGVWADEEDRTAIVIVNDNQLSLAIGREGQNARLAAKLTGYKIDIKSETKARETGLYDELGISDEEYVGYYEEYDEEDADDGEYSEDGEYSAEAQDDEEEAVSEDDES
ncbi:MAG: transcription termination/antitermination protein NusA [Lachnospiraceae bacterium]|nr:transcription termination/antitermination protein NusA [Lachnospiraceae bacterium]